MDAVVQGYVVFAVEHADGTASTAKLAEGAGCLYYQGWGTEENRMRQTRYAICFFCSRPDLNDKSPGFLGNPSEALQVVRKCIQQCLHYACRIVCIYVNPLYCGLAFMHSNRTWSE